MLACTRLNTSLNLATIASAFSQSKRSLAIYLFLLALSSVLNCSKLTL